MKSPIFVSLCFLSVLAQAHAEVIINEIHYDPIEPGLNNEFIELLNAGDTAVDVSRWRLSGAASFTIPDGTVPIDAGDYLVITLDPDGELFDEVTALGPWDGRLSSEGERVVLRKSDDVVMDEVDYDVRFPWPITPAGDGSSMELINPALDNDLGSSWRPSKTEPTPGKANSTLTDNPPPNVRQANHDPKQPTSADETTITIKLTDSDGVTNVVLHYLIVEPGNYIPAYSPWARSSLLADPDAPRRLSAGYAEGLFTGTWPTIEMTEVDPDMADGETNNDALFAVTLPAQPHRTLVRYYVTADDGKGASVRAPLKDDPSLNFAYFVYDGVPDYVASEDSSQGNGHVYSSELLQQLPVYHLLTRNEDWLECLAYNAGDQHPRSSMSARTAYNWSGTIVYDGRVYDNIAYRLRGGNGRYQLRGKRSMKYKFNRGNYFRPKNNRGEPYPTTWRVLTTSKMYGNRISGTLGTRQGPGNFGLVDTVNGQMWELFGVPAVRTHWFHFRVIDDAEEAPDQYGGDFYGLNLAQERIDVRFLESRGLARGNLYKLTDQSENFDGVGGKGSASDGKQQQRYQAPDAVQNAEDYTNIFSQLRASKDDEWLRKHVNWDIWYRYTAVEEAIRHYDYWVDADKNMVQYFHPQPGNALGQLWQLPYDSDASWGPSWNAGIDLPQAAVDRKDNFQLELKNTMREFRDLIWQPEVIDHLIDDAAAIIEDFHPADWDRWRDAPSATGSEDFGTLASKVADMKLFAFEGGLNYPGGNVGEGGRAAVLDSMMEDKAIPKQPVIGIAAEGSAAIDQVVFESDAYKAASLFTPSSLSKVQWRIAEVTDESAPAYDPGALRNYEAIAIWSVDAAAETDNPLIASVPANLLKVGHAYRARARHWDVDGRASHWSEPVAFIAEAPRAAAGLLEDLVITELMYHPAPAAETGAEAGLDESDFEFVELWNRGGAALDLTDVRFTKGIDFDFPAGTSLAPGAYALIVSSKEGMSTRYGEGLPIIGEWDANTSLSNGGERLKLSFGAGNALIEFRYDDVEPWAVTADGAGHALELVGQESIQTASYGDASAWRASVMSGGTPGRASGGPGPEPDPSDFNDWLAANGLSDANADPDMDGITHFGAYAMAVDLLGDAIESSSALPSIETTSDGKRSLSVRRRAAGVSAVLQASNDLQQWTEVATAATPPETDPDSSVHVSYSLDGRSEQFWRVRFAIDQREGG